MQNLMAQAQRMQREITAKKEELEKMEFVGKSEWVEVTGKIEKGFYQTDMPIIKVETLLCVPLVVMVIAKVNVIQTI